MILEVKTSEPRDALQLERTCLSLIRFASTLFITSLGILMNFKIDSASPEPADLYSTIVAYLLIGVSILFLIVTLGSYLVTLSRYKSGKIHSFGFNNWLTSVLLAVLVSILAFICISLFIESYEL